jgi:hypothetical protein
MKKLCVLAGALWVVALLANNVLGLEIRVAPKTLVLSSDGGKATVHTDVPFEMAESVSLYVDGSSVEVRTFEDDRGFLVAQCSKDAVREVLGDIGDKFITVTFRLEVDDAWAEEKVRVKE